MVPELEAGIAPPAQEANLPRIRGAIALQIPFDDESDRRDPMGLEKGEELRRQFLLFVDAERYGRDPWEVVDREAHLSLRLPERRQGENREGEYERFHPFTSAYTLASHAKIGSRATHHAGTTRP